MTLHVDLHIHSCLSPCGDALMTPNNIAGMAFLKGLDVIAVTDHNTAGNLVAVAEAAQAVGVCLLPGLEVTTSEEVHVLCYFAHVEQALAFGAMIYEHLPGIPNNPAYFGEQLYLNAQDEPVGTEEKLLISATDLSLSQVVRLCADHGGISVPAHINRGSNGVLNVLGFLPPQDDFAALEVNIKSEMPPGDFSKWRILRSSDAHYIEDILEATVTLEAADRSAPAVFEAIRGSIG